MPTKATLQFFEENGIADEPQETTAQPNNELFEMLLDAKDLTEEKINKGVLKGKQMIMH